MFTKLFSRAALAGVAIMAAQTVSAATYTIDNVENGTLPGFGFSLFHEATGPGGMSGTYLATAIEDTASGTWDSVTGAIDIDFDVKRLSDDVTIEVAGTGFVLGTTDPWYIDFTFSAAIGGLNSAKVWFLDYDYGVPNAFDGSYISLWGAAVGDGFSPPTSGGMFDPDETTIGVDLRISVVPIPAAGLLLLGGLGALGVVRRRRKAA